MVDSNASSEKPNRVRPDGRRSLLVYLNADLIVALKKAALDDDANVYEIVEEAARMWLGEREKSRRGASHSPKQAD